MLASDLLDLDPLEEQPPPSHQYMLVEIMMLPDAFKSADRREGLKAFACIFDVVVSVIVLLLANSHEFARNVCRNEVEEITKLRYALACYFFADSEHRL